MTKSPRTPKDIAKPNKKTYAYYISVDVGDKLKDLASKDHADVSPLVEEAIRYYIKYLESKQKSKGTKKSST